MDNKKWRKVVADKKVVNFIFFRKIIKKKKNIKIIYNRSLQIIPGLLNVSFYVYKGNLFKILKPFKYMVGFKLGEFSFTRKPFFFPKKIKKKKNLLRR